MYSKIILLHGTNSSCRTEIIFILKMYIIKQRKNITLDKDYFMLHI